MTDSVARPEDLVAKWRDKGRRQCETSKRMNSGVCVARPAYAYAEGLSEAADELEAALRTPSEAERFGAAMDHLAQENWATVQRREARIVELEGALRELVNATWATDDVRIMARVTFGAGPKVEEYMARIDGIDEALKVARRALSQPEAKAKVDG